MKLKFIFYFLFFTSIILILASCSNGQGKLDEFAQCLTESGAVMYGTQWCSHCQSQKEEFGKSFKYVDYVDCDFNKEECVRNGVKGYPTWKISGEYYSGEQSMYKLASLSGCELPEEV